MWLAQIILKKNWKNNKLYFVHYIWSRLLTWACWHRKVFWCKSLGLYLVLSGERKDQEDRTCTAGCERKMEENVMMMMWNNGEVNACWDKKKVCGGALESLSSIINISSETRGSPKQRHRQREGEGEGRKERRRGMLRERDCRRRTEMENHRNE